MHISPADITQDASGTPFSEKYQDCYFSRKDGLQESRYVFLEGNQLPSKWANKTTVVIGETGFGSGLNFLATWDCWRNDPSAPEQLHFISIEKHPLNTDQLKQCLSPWKEISDLRKQLIKQYPALVSGVHRLTFENSKVSLTLFFMDVGDALQQFNHTVDHWFLDGFSPAKNPAMWDQKNLAKLVQFSHEGTTLATFTAASNVRKNLEAVGIQIKKRKGFGKKREMLTGTVKQKQKYAKPSPWFNYTPTQITSNKHTIIIGGGIAACQLAWHLAGRNWKVTLIERHKRLATEASGNPAGVIAPKMTAQANIGESFYIQSFIYALQQIVQLQKMGLPIEFHACGNLQLCHNEREQKRWDALQSRAFPHNFLKCLSANEASDIAGIDIHYPSILFPSAGWVNPQVFCKALVQHPNIQVQTEIQAIDICYQPHQWLINTKNGIVAKASHLVIANGKDAGQFQQTHYLPFTPIRGQTSQATASTFSQQLKSTLGHEGYITPSHHNEHIFGATFERSPEHILSSHHADQVNLDQLQTHLPKLANNLHSIQPAHAATRMTTPDRFPYVGAIPDLKHYQKTYSDLHQGRHWKHYPSATYLPNLFISSGYGSRGLTTSALCSEMLACLMNDEPLPLQKALVDALHPARFIIRALKRNQTI